MQPIIIHLDMNSYFASVAQQDNPEFRGKPLGVCEHLGGIIIAASIEAKRWGIKTGTPVWEARKIYPKIILQPTKPDRYRFFTRKFLKVMSDYSSQVEPYSIDEAFMDLTKACNVRRSDGSRVTGDRLIVANPFEEAVRIALEIKRRMKTEVGDYLTCSIGIAENKLLAKIGSDMKKPDGVVVIRPSSCVIPSPGTIGRGIPYIGELSGVKGSLHSSDALLGRDDTSKIIFISKEDLYYRLKLIDIPGIGRRQEKNLAALGIRTLADLRDYPKSHLISRFGKIGGYHLYNLGQLKASWKAPVHQDREMKSIGHMYTLPKEYREPKFFLPVLYKLCEMVARRMRKQGLMGNTVHFFCHDKNYEGFGKSIRLGYFVRDGREIFSVAADLLRGFNRGLLEVKLIGITVAGLRPYINQLSLFGDAERQKRLLTALDKINGKYGDFTLCRAQILAAKDVFQDSVGFGRVKEL